MKLSKNLPEKNSISKIRILLILLCCITTFITVYIFRGERPYTSKTNMAGYLLVDSLPSLMFAIIITQLSFIRNPINETKFEEGMHICAIAAGLIIVEVTQLFTNTGTFDLFDIAAIIIAIPVSVFIEKIIVIKGAKR